MSTDRIRLETAVRSRVERVLRMAKARALNRKKLIRHMRHIRRDTDAWSRVLQNFEMEVVVSAIGTGQMKVYESSLLQTSSSSSATKPRERAG